MSEQPSIISKNTKKRFLRNKTQKAMTGYLFILPNFIGFMVFTLIPIIMGFAISFTNYNGFKQRDFVGIQNYLNMFKDDYFRVSAMNNLVYAIVTVPAIIIFAILLAVALNSRLPAKSFFKTIFFFPTITSMVAVGIVWTMIFSPSRGPLNQLLMLIGMDNPPQWLLSTKYALFSVMIVAIWKQTGYYMIIVLAGLQSIPRYLYESAEIDGAGSVKRFFFITLPMLSPTIFLITILNLISSFQVFDLIAIMTDGGPGRATNVLVFRIYQEGFKYLNYGYASAMAYFLFMIILTVTLIQFQGQKKWVTYM